MHELSLCQRMLTLILEIAAEKKCKRVKKVNLEVGQLVAVEPSALTLSFQLLTQGTIAENAILSVIDIHGKAVCNSCGSEINITQYYEICSACGQCSWSVTAGEHLRIHSMEVE